MVRGRPKVGVRPLPETEGDAETDATTSVVSALRAYIGSTTA